VIRVPAHLLSQPDVAAAIQALRAALAAAEAEAAA
jgi:hypothetical protein